MNKEQLEKILDIAKDYFISDISIIECYNKYAEANGLDKFNLDEERADMCGAPEARENAPESPRGEKCNSVPERDPRPADVKIEPLLTQSDLFSLLSTLARSNKLSLTKIKSDANIEGSIMADGRGNLYNCGFMQNNVNLNLNFTMKRDAFLQVNDLLSKVIKQK